MPYDALRCPTMPYDALRCPTMPYDALRPTHPPMHTGTHAHTPTGKLEPARVPSPPLKLERFTFPKNNSRHIPRTFATTSFVTTKNNGHPQIQIRDIGPNGSGCSPYGQPSRRDLCSREIRREVDLRCPKENLHHLPQLTDTRHTNMKHSVEITKEAALLLVGNPEKSWHNFKQEALYEKTIYKAHGVFVAVFHNYVLNLTQYFVQDINA